jgi:stage II sporulation protein D
MAGKVFPVDKLFIKTNQPDAVIINGRTFRGDIKLIKNSDMTLSVINYIELEDYIKGISVREISHYWPPEALKAEVIVFRTFALYKMQENAAKEYDLTSDIYSQVYSGRAAERYRINKAVDQTKDKVLMYRGKIFPAFYHATCAGHTEDASLLWNIDLAPLKGVACNFCKDSPHFKWHDVLTKEEIKDKLVASGYKINRIKAIQILGRDESGRIRDLSIIGENKNINITAKDFRELIGPNTIKSTNFQANTAGDDVVFEGLGWGHGVGLCQWGAYFMAKQGYKYDEILRYYYPQADVKTIGF